MYNGGHSDPFGFFAIEAKLFGNGIGKLRHPALVTGSVGVSAFSRSGQSHNGFFQNSSRTLQVQTGILLRSLLLSNIKAYLDHAGYFACRIFDGITSDKPAFTIGAQYLSLFAITSL